MKGSEEFDDYYPVWGRVLVLPDDIQETDEDLKRIKTAIPGFEIADKNIEQEQYKQTEGRLVRAGGDCFETWKGTIPKEGDKVLFNKFGGKVLKDGMHRLINDTDILMVIAEK